MNRIVVGMLQAVGFITVSTTLEYLLWKIISVAAVRKEYMWLLKVSSLLRVIFILVPIEAVMYFGFLIMKYYFLCSDAIPFEFYAGGRFIPMSILLAVWGFGFIKCRISERNMFKRYAQTAEFGIPMPEKYLAIYKEECKKLKLKTCPEIQINKYAASPCVIQYKGRDIIQFPNSEIGEEEFRAICSHELYHVKHHDNQWKRMASWVESISWFNPIAWLIAAELSFWIEVSRDAEAVEHNGIPAMRYYRYIVKYMKNERLPFVLSAAAGTNQLLKRREIVMKLSGGRRLYSRIGMGLIFALFVIGSAMTTYAGIETMRVGTVNIYEGLADEEKIIEFDPDTEYVEDTEDIDVSEYMSLNPLTRAQSLTWTIYDNDRVESVEIYIKAGQKLKLAGFADTDNIAFKYGYTSHVKDWYCLATSSFSHDFVIEESGYYSIYFRNLSAFKFLTVHFMYDVYD